MNATEFNAALDLLKVELRDLGVARLEVVHAGALKDLSFNVHLGDDMDGVRAQIKNKIYRSFPDTPITFTINGSF